MAPRSGPKDVVIAMYSGLAKEVVTSGWFVEGLAAAVAGYCGVARLIANRFSRVLESSRRITRGGAQPGSTEHGRLDHLGGPRAGSWVGR